MELAFFPIAAILLLLSGVSAPAHAAVQQGTAAALIRGIFADRAASPVRAATYTTSRRSGSSVPQRGGQFPPSPLAQSEGRFGARPQVLRPARGFERKQYRTRFGFADGAYLALGPPSRDSEFQLHSTVRG